MKANNSQKIFLAFFSLFLFFFALPAKAVCPVCTVAVGACVGLSRYLGIDDSISGLWIGGLIISLIVWTINWLNKKNIIFYGRKILTAVIYYAIIIIPLYFKDIAGHPLNRLWGLDKLILGIILGSLAFLLAIFFNSWLKNKNAGKVFFPFQKVAVPIAFLLILSFVFYSITC